VKAIERAGDESDVVVVFLATFLPLAVVVVSERRERRVFAVDAPFALARLRRRRRRRRRRRDARAAAPAVLRGRRGRSASSGGVRERVSKAQARVYLPQRGGVERRQLKLKGVDGGD